MNYKPIAAPDKNTSEKKCFWKLAAINIFVK